ncbi:4Fe-4S dicluster domain-containing protein [Enterobacter sp. CC120223-11]|uniref:4Fe-4S dicluster domain-containing protein n=1 Tax=Enterobacter sp. CC120223-11 TaxID=1378073 RepID=UPI000BC3F80F|nr:4Fe-4S dicluster domain-containing protein [Enterobacter sp. CC120223-11]SNY75237.1 hydrogenase-4 component A [Enterobacter sp. CC120223-11]
MNRFVIADPQWCIGCNTCLAACSDVHKAEGLQQHPRLTMARTGDHTAPVLCRHCEDAPCKRVCPVNAIALEGDSVQINESLCIGCKLCGLVCPFGAITPAGSTPLNVPKQYEHFVPASMLSDVPVSADSMDPFLSWNAGVRAVAVKCDLCNFLPEGPACVRACPTKTLHLVEPKSVEAQMKQRRAQTALSMPETLPGRNQTGEQN